MIYFFDNLMSKIERTDKIINISDTICKKLIQNSYKNMIFPNYPACFGAAR